MDIRDKNATSINGKVISGVPAADDILKFNGTKWLPSAITDLDELLGFYADNSVFSTGGTATDNTVSGYTEVLDTGGVFNPTTGIFTALESGYYIISFRGYSDTANLASVSLKGGQGGTTTLDTFTVGLSNSPVIISCIRLLEPLDQVKIVAVDTGAVANLKEIQFRIHKNIALISDLYDTQVSSDIIRISQIAGYGYSLFDIDSVNFIDDIKFSRTEDGDIPVIQLDPKYSVNRNLLTNTEFTTDLTGWAFQTYAGTGTATRDTSEKLINKNSLKIITDSSYAGNLQQEVVLPAFKIFRISFWAKGEVGGENFIFNIYDGTGDFNSVVKTLTTEWRQYSFSFVTKVAGNHFIRAWQHSGGQARVLWLSKIQLEAWSNSLEEENNFSSPIWTKQTGVTVSQGYSDPLGGNEAWLLDLTGASVGTGIFQALSRTDSQNKTRSIWMKTISGTGGITITNPDQTLGFVTVTITNEWQQFSLTDTNDSFGIWLKKDSLDQVLIYEARINLGTKIATDSNVYFPRKDNTAVKTLNLGSAGAVGDGTFVNGTSANMLSSDGLFFDATSSQYIDTNYSRTTGDQTLFIKFNFSDVTDVTLFGADTNGGYEAFISGSGKIITAKGGLTFLTNGNAVIPTDTDTVVAIRFIESTGASAIFVNGVLDKEATHIVTFDPGKKARIGTQSTVLNLISGTIYSYLEYESALSNEEITAISNLM